MNFDYDKIIEKLQEYIALYGLNVISAIAILILGWIAAKVARSIIVGILNKNKVEQTLVKFVASVSYIAMLAFVIVAAISKLGIQTASFVAVIGAAGLAIGLALQGSLSNFAAGVLMIMFKPLKVGDVVEGAGVKGKVVEVGIFCTVIDTPDNKKIIVPNGKLAGDNIINYTAYEKRRVDLVIGVGYDDDIDLVRKTIIEVCEADEKILKEPELVVEVLELADSSVNFAVRPWCKPEDYWDVYFKVQENCKKKFDELDITIPYPQQDVHMHTVTKD